MFRVAIEDKNYLETHLFSSAGETVRGVENLKEFKCLFAS
jgi:hypothetical protein